MGNNLGPHTAVIPDKTYGLERTTQPDETVERTVERMPLGRRGLAADVADVVVFLVSDDRGG